MYFWNDFGSMITLRQIEALQWIVMLGTFDRAARRLGLTQSAISKRIHELEAATGITLFDRSGRGAYLTPEGGRVLAMGREMLSMRERIVQIGTQNSRPRRLVRLGITELTALTWLPRLMGALRASGSADIDIKPEVGLSRHLFRELVHGNLDLIVIPEVFFGSGRVVNTPCRGPQCLDGEPAAGHKAKNVFAGGTPRLDDPVTGLGLWIRRLL